jgi:hypothetical protein
MAQPQHRITRGLFFLLMLAAALSLAGCATTGEESDMPWNAPQPWEGSPTLPGMNQGQ